jgi:hypothetical protein
MLFESVLEYEVSGGSGGLRNIRITQRRGNGLSWFEPIRSLRPAADDPYTQEHLKSRGLQQSVKEEEFGRGLARANPKVASPPVEYPPRRRGRRWWDAVEERLSVPISRLPCSRCRAVADGMEWSVW